jgi:predicted ribosomally synthesized peptide with SipW-like signal peptide
MTNEEQNTEITLSRRKILAGTGAVGVSSLGAGVGTSALFSDEERFEDNRLAAGELDMKVSWEEHYSDLSEDEREHAHLEGGELVVVDREGYMGATLQEQFPDKRTRKRLDGGAADPCEVLADIPDDRARPVFELPDVKPGDFGEVIFDFALCDNPGWVWMNGSLREDAENGLTEPESDAPDEDGNTGPMAGELAEKLQVVMWYDDGFDNFVDPEDRLFFRGTLAEALTLLSQGPKGLRLGRTATDSEPGCFDPEEQHRIGFGWWLPREVGNAVQSDSVAFDLGFYTEQWRNNERPGVPVADDGDVDACVYELEVREVHYEGDNVGPDAPPEPSDWVVSGTINGREWTLDVQAGPPADVVTPGTVVREWAVAPGCPARTVEMSVEALEDDGGGNADDDAVNDVGLSPLRLPFFGKIYLDFDYFRFDPLHCPDSQSPTAEFTVPTSVPGDGDVATLRVDLHLGAECITV